MDKKKMITLQAEDRQGNSPQRLRREGKIPGVFYGQGSEAVSLSVNDLDFSRVYAEAGENTVLTIVLPGGAKENALISEVAREPVSGAVIHVDFYRVRMDEAVEASIPVVFEGESPAVRALGGVLVKALDEVRVSCLPADLPHEIGVDISLLVDFDTQLRVADLVVPKGVALLDDPTVTIALVEAPRSDAEMEALDTKVEADVTKVEGVADKVSLSSGGEKK